MKSKVPKWFQLVAERDYLDYYLCKMYDEVKKRPPIYKMIDEATGFDKARLKEATIIIRRIKTINKLLTNPKP